MTLDDDTLQRFHDGELSPALERSVRAQLDKDPEARARVAELARLSEAFQLSAEEWAKDLDADALFADIRSDLEKHPKAGVVERLQVITGELGGRRQHFLGPAIGFAVAAAVTLAFLSAEPAPSDGPPSQGGEARVPVKKERTAIAANVPPTQVEDIDFGSSTGTVFEVESEGVTTAVVWIADEEEGAGP